MSELFIRLYLDEDVSALVAKLIRSRAFFVVTTAESSQLGKTDLEQLAFAADKGMVIVTHKRSDFEKLANDYRVYGTTHAGIIIAVRRRENELARRLLKILNSMTADEIENQVLYI